MSIFYASVLLLKFVITFIYQSLLWTHLPAACVYTSTLIMSAMVQFIISKRTDTLVNFSILQWGEDRRVKSEVFGCNISKIAWTVKSQNGPANLCGCWTSRKGLPDALQLFQCWPTYPKSHFVTIKNDYQKKFSSLNFKQMLQQRAILQKPIKQQYYWKQHQ